MALTEEQEGQILQAIGQFGEFMKNFQSQHQKLRFTEYQQTKNLLSQEIPRFFAKKLKLWY